MITNNRRSASDAFRFFPVQRLIIVIVVIVADYVLLLVMVVDIVMVKSSQDGGKYGNSDSNDELLASILHYL